MEFLRVVGGRRSIRWFRPWQQVPQAAIQRILEVARLSTSPGNVQPWRAVVVRTEDLDPGERRRLLEANNEQRAQEQAPVWIYWFADPSAARPEVFLRRVLQQLPIGAIPAAFGWSEERARAAILEGTPAAPGLPALHHLVHQMPEAASVVVAIQETNAALALAQLAAVEEGLGTCLHTIAMAPHLPDVKAILNLPDGYLPVWLQLVGYPAEGVEAGGQRPRIPFDELYALGRWGSPFPRDPAVVEQLERDGLIQAQAPLPGRFEELEHLARMFGYPADGGAGERTG
jgi:nitroreductase